MKRPPGVTFLAVLAIVGGAINILYALPYLGVSIALPGSITAGLSVGAAVLASLGVGLLLVGLVQLMFGIGAIGLRPWAWVMGVIGYGFSLITSAVSLATVAVTSGMVLTAVVAGIILLYLYSHDVRMAFDHEDGSLFHSGHHTPMGAA